MVVADPGLIARRMTGRFDAPHHAGAGEGVQGVVDGLGGQGSQPGARAGRDRLGVEVRAVLKRGQDGQAGPGDAQTAGASAGRASGIEACMAGASDIAPSLTSFPGMSQDNCDRGAARCSTGPVHLSPGP